MWANVISSCVQLGHSVCSGLILYHCLCTHVCTHTHTELKIFVFFLCNLILWSLRWEPLEGKDSHKLFFLLLPSLHGILHARILELVAVPSFRGSRGIFKEMRYVTVNWCLPRAFAIYLPLRRLNPVLLKLFTFHTPWSIFSGTEFMNPNLASPHI